MYKVIVIGVVVGLLGAAGYFGYRYWQLQQSVATLDASKEISSSSIEKDGKTWTIRIESLIAEPIDAVWGALKAPERGSELVPEAFRKSELLSEEGTRKTLALEVSLLSLPVQKMKATLDYDESARRVGIETSEGMQDIRGRFELEDDGQGRTVFRFDGTATDRISLPLPAAVIEGALREFFVVQVRMVKAAIGGGSASVAAAEEDSGPKRLCESEDVRLGEKYVSITVAPVGEEPLIADPERGEFQEQTPDGSRRRYLVDEILVDEDWDSSTKCNVTTAVVGGELAVRIESINLFASTLETDWVRELDWEAMVEVASAETATEPMIVDALPAVPRTWRRASFEVAPALPDPLVSRLYGEALF